MRLLTRRSSKVRLWTADALRKIKRSVSLMHRRRARPGGSPPHLQDLPPHSCLYLGEDERHRHWRFRRTGAAVTVKVSGRYVADHSEVRLQRALGHPGIASLPEFTARAALAAGELVTVLGDWEHASDYAGMAWLLYPPNRFLPAKLRVWIDHLVAGLGCVATGRE